VVRAEIQRGKRPTTPSRSTEASFSKYTNLRCPAPTAQASSNHIWISKRSNPAPFYPTPPHHRHSREGGRERSDRRSKSRQHNLTGSYEAYHEHQCPTSQPARVGIYRPCRDIPPVRPLLSYGQFIPTHLTLPEPTSTHPVLLHQNPPSTRAAKTNSSLDTSRQNKILLRRRTALRTRPAEQGRRMSHPVRNSERHESIRILPSPSFPRRRTRAERPTK